MADTGATPPTKEPREQRYLSLDPRGEFDPRITTLPARLYKMFIQMRMMSLSGDTPGVLDIAWPALCECLGIRSPALQDCYAQKLEERGLIGIRKDDEAVIIARWTMPQLDAQGFKREPLPRRRYPSDFRRKQAARQPVSENAQESVQKTPGEATPSAELQQFFDAATRLAESGAEGCGADAESARSGETNLKKERKKERKKESQSLPPNPPAAESDVEPRGVDVDLADSGQAGQAGGQGSVFVSDTERKDIEQALLAQKVHAGNAHSLAYAADLDAGQVYAQIAALPDRNGDDPPGLLVTAIRQRLPLPPAYIERLQAQADKQRIAGEQLEAEAKREARLRESDAQIARILATTQGAESEGNYATL